MHSIRGVGRKRRLQNRLAEERWRHDLRRRSLKKAQRIARQSSKPDVAAEYRSVVLDSFCIDRFTERSKRPRGTVARFTIPAVFSLSRNAEESISFLRRVAKAARSCRNPRIILDHRKVKYMGLAADTVLGLILNEIQREAEAASRAYIKGYKPVDPAIRKMMDEVGSVRAVHEYEERLKVDLKSNERVFRFYHRYKSGLIDPFDTDVVARTVQRFADHMNACLALVDMELTESGMQRLLEYVSEVISNADEHSTTREWAAVGYVDVQADEVVYQCVIASVGATMAQKFTKLPRDSFAWNCVEPYLERHRKKGLFGSGWKQEDLLAVVCLQGDISSMNESREGTRGQGTVDLIEFFQSVHDECQGSDNATEMHILTGTTLMKFDGAHRMLPDPDTGRKTIAFNAANSLEDRPSPEHVRVLNAGLNFPGVVISVRLPLGESAVRGTKREAGVHI